MTSKDDSFGYWSGWMAAFGVAAAFFVFTVWQGASLKEAACKPEEADCFRQWVAALGGWATVVAAVPSIIYLGRQIKAADRQYRTNTALTLYRNRALARHIAIFSRYALERMGQQLSKVPADPGANDILNLMSSIEDLLADARLEKFEQEIVSPPVSVTLVRQNIDSYKVALERVLSNPIYKDHVFGMLIEVLSVTQNYFRVVSDASDGYLNTTSSFAAEYIDETHA